MGCIELVKEKSAGVAIEMSKKWRSINFMFKQHCIASREWYEFCNVEIFNKIGANI